MTSTTNQAQSLQRLALEVIQNDPQKAGALVKLLHAFKGLRTDPEGEIVMDEVIAPLYWLTDHCQSGLKDFLSIAA